MSIKLLKPTQFLNAFRKHDNSTKINLVSVSTPNFGILEFWNFNYVNQIAEAVDIKVRHQHDHHQFKFRLYLESRSRDTFVKNFAGAW